MNNLYIAAFMLILGFVLNFWLFPRNKTINIAGDQVNDPKIKDNRKDKSRRKGLFGFLKADPVKKMERQNRATDKRMKRLKARALRKKK